ncbi:MAG: helix-turn-helix domain-containing protein [Desulfobacterales bacterium]|nr:helix-turn-helix domain-containing protein [Desulfobacterales bacterium]
MFKKRVRVSSGIDALDRLLSGVFIGDNVIWYDDAGSLANAFSFNFIQESQSHNKSLIYVNFDRSPKKILEDLGPLAESQHLTILDGFTHGKGDGSEVFNKFYEKDGAQWPFQIIKVKEPWKPDQVSDAVYSLHKTMQGDVRLVFESLTGMQDLWGGEDLVLKFYSHACPRLYELDTIAYWIMEKDAHSNRLKAHINQIAQVAIELSIKRGRSTLNIIKADNRKPAALNEPISFWNDGMTVVLETAKRKIGIFDLGLRIKELRTAQAISQKKLADMVGVTPSTISQIESNSIYPSLPALFKIAQTLNVEIGSFFQGAAGGADRVVFTDGRTKINFADLPTNDVEGYRLSPVDFDGKAEPYLLEIPAGKKLSSHFFAHKGEEMGYLLSGQLELTLKNAHHHAKAGDIIYLTDDIPSQWRNTGASTCRLLWIKIK